MLGVLGLDPVDAHWSGAGTRGQSADDRGRLVSLALEQRTAARTRKDWAAADAIREQLKQGRHRGRRHTDTVRAGPSEQGKAPDARKFGAAWPSDDARRRAQPAARAVRAAARSRAGAGPCRPRNGRGTRAYSGTEDVPQRTAWKQDKERRAAAAEGRAPKAGQPGTVDTTWGKGTKGRKAVPKAGSAGRGSPAGRGDAGGRSSAGGRGAASRARPAVARRRGPVHGSHPAASRPLQRTRPSCWSAVTRWSRPCGHASRLRRCTWRSASTSTTA